MDFRGAEMQALEASHRLAAKDIEIERLRAALEVCAADYISDPCTVIEGHSMLSIEFRRRMKIAHDALSQ